MPHLIIDDIAVEVPAGTTVIAAAEQVGIMIPRFCYLKALGSVGACRMCAVSFLAGPVRGIQMSCMVKAMDGMVVSTTSPEAVAYRRQIIEWLMVNHPHDCPVCDEGGRCLLQDETVSGGHTARRFPGKKRTYLDQDLGPFVQHEMNRCIHCYRCVRFYQDYAGSRDFGTMRIGNRVYYGRFTDGPLESPFAGNLADICPTGVFTDKPARYKARYWDLQRSATVCLHCSLGCNTTVNAFQQAILRQEARESEAVNGSFICDRGRFGCLYANHPERPRQPLVEGREASWEQALAAAGERLALIVQAAGPGSIAVLGSGRASLETMSQIHRCGRVLNWRTPSAYGDPGLAHKISRAVARLDTSLARSLGEIQTSDFILVAGADPLQEAPMLALALRQAARNGALVVVIDPRPVVLPFTFTHLPTAPGDIEARLAVLVGLAVAGEPREKLAGEFLALAEALASPGQAEADPSGQLALAAEKLKASRNPVLVCGTEVVRESTPDFAADLAMLLQASLGGCGLFYLFPEVNTYGAALFADQGQPSFLATLQDIEDNAIKAVIAVESDPLFHYPDRQRLKQAFAKLELLVVLDYLPSATSASAQILLPTATPFETGSHFINQEGRIQFAHPVQTSAAPLAQSGGGSHPPRLYSEPGNDESPRPAWRVLEQLLRIVSGEKPAMPGSEMMTLMAAAAPGLARLRLAPYPGDNLRIVPPPSPPETFRFSTSGPVRESQEGDTLELILAPWTFGTEELSCYAEPINRATGEPLLTMHPDDAARAGVGAGDTVRLHLDRGILEIPLRLSADMARGVIVLPRHHRLDWQQIHACQERLPSCRIEKA